MPSRFSLCCRAPPDYRGFDHGRGPCSVPGRQRRGGALPATCQYFAERVAWARRGVRLRAGHRTRLTKEPTMTISALNSLYSTVSGILGGSNNSSSASGAANASSTTQIADSQQFSPAAEMLSLLQQLQQSNPTEFQQVTSQITNNLQSAAKTAQSAGNSTLATQLNQLASDFQNVSQTGWQPIAQDLQQAGVGGHHHHHHHAESSSSASTTSSSSSSSSNGSSSPLEAIFNSLASNGSSATGSSSSSLNPTAIIFNTLESSGLLNGGSGSTNTFAL
jgi:preprotein translocase subunit SecD